MSEPCPSHVPQVPIPAGVDTGMNLCVRGKGEAGAAARIDYGYEKLSREPIVVACEDEHLAKGSRPETHSVAAQTLPPHGRHDSVIIVERLAHPHEDNIRNDHVR